MAPPGNKKVANGLVALSSAAIVAVYSAGFLRTKAAAAKMDAADQGRRPMIPAPSTAGESSTPLPIEPPMNLAPAVARAASPAVVTPQPATTAKASTKAAAEPEATVSTAGARNAEPDPVAVQEQNPSNSRTADEAPTAASAGLPMPKEKYKDGTYTGWGTCRHGDIQATVTIEGGRITATSISQCWTRYSCSWVAHLPGQIVARQSPDCDYVTGATQSANAFYWAVVDALNKAK